MTVLRRIILVVLIATIVTAAWLWWNRPSKVDMATYAPAESLVYLESNNIANVAAAISNTEAWKKLSPIVGNSHTWSNDWLWKLSAWTGIGPIQTVIASRAQVAVVVLDLGTAEEGDTLRVRPEAALLIETHTSPLRMRSTVEQTLRRMAMSAYQNPDFKKTEKNGFEYLVWTAPNSSRQIAAVIDDSLVIVGNSERVLDTCLGVRHGQRANLRNDPDLQTMRRDLDATHALAFGYVSSNNAARLIALGAPIVLGQSEADQNLQQLISNAAGKIVGTLGWSSFAWNSLIEDRYVFTLKDPVSSRLQPAFKSTDIGSPPFQFLPEKVFSVSQYKFEDPLLAWKSLENAALSRLDALSAAVFKAFIKSALSPYGIDDPERFLTLVGPTILTLRTQSNAERAVLVASVRDETALRKLILQQMGGSPKRESYGRAELLNSPDSESCVAFVDNFLLTGSPSDVKSCLDRLASSNHDALKFFLPAAREATVVTYTNDADRVRSFMLAVSRATDRPMLFGKTQSMDQAIAELPYSMTETTLGSEGIERRTRSPLGQFSNLAALFYPAER